MTEGDSAFRQIVRGEFQGYFVAGEDANAVAAETARQVGQDDALVFQLNTEQAAREFFKNSAGNFDAVFFAHKPRKSEPALGSDRRRLAIY